MTIQNIQTKEFIREKNTMIKQNTQSVQEIFSPRYFKLYQKNIPTQCDSGPFYDMYY